MSKTMGALRTLVIGAFGGWLGTLIGLPSPWLIGALLAAMLAHRFGISLYMPVGVTAYISWILGLSLASSVDENVGALILDWSASLLFMLLMLAISMITLFHFYTRKCAWLPVESLLASAPGNLNVVMTYALEQGLDLKRIATVHTLRIFIIVSSLPLLFPIQDRDTSEQLIEAAHWPVALSVVLAAGFVGYLIARLRVPAGMMIGAFSTTLFAKLALGIELVITPDLFHLILVVLGTLSAIRISGIELSTLKKMIVPAMGGVGLTLIISSAFALALYAVTDIPLLQALLAYLPGGVEVAIAIAFSTDVDPIYVATHQVIRYMAVSLSLPLLHLWMSRQSPGLSQ